MIPEINIFLKINKYLFRKIYRVCLGAFGSGLSFIAQIYIILELEVILRAMPPVVEKRHGKHSCVERPKDEILVSI